MNKIILVNDNLQEIINDDAFDINITKKNDFFDITSIKLMIKKDTSLEIEYIIENDIKHDITIEVLDGVNFKLFEKRIGNKTKVQYKYIINKNSYIKIDKFYDVEEIKESDVINLNKEGATIDYNLKTISKNKEKYDIRVNHNFSNTNSNIKNNAVNILDGEITFNVSSFVFKDKKNCFVEQNNRIINLTNNKCKVNPNLFIDENDVVANHSALIGTFNEDEMFYLQSRGIDKISATNLLIKGFLLSEIDLSNDRLLELTQTIDKYWR